VSDGGATRAGFPTWWRVPRLTLVGLLRSRRMRWYEVQYRDPDGHWHGKGDRTQSIKYAYGFQDALLLEDPLRSTRIVWIRGSRQEVIRLRGPINQETMP
jgi:hypothetical protein